MSQTTTIARPPSTAQQVHDWLHQRIIQGDLLPGARLSETEIADQIGL